MFIDLFSHILSLKVVLVPEFSGSHFIYVYFARLFVCSFVFNKRPNSWTDQAQHLWGNSHGPRESLKLVKNLCGKKGRNLLFFYFIIYGSFNPILIKTGGGGGGQKPIRWPFWKIKTNLSKNIVGKVKTVTVK